jgi:PadR family transcriptional regulator, regulatory protein PadR
MRARRNWLAPSVAATRPLAHAEHLFYNLEEIGGGVPERLTGLEELVFLAVGGLGTEAYGISIQDKLQRAGLRASLGVVYATLDRLEEKGFVESSLGEASAVRGGRRKRLFRATPKGRAALAAMTQIRARLLRNVERTA